MALDHHLGAYTIGSRHLRSSFASNHAQGNQIRNTCFQVTLMSMEFIYETWAYIHFICMGSL